MRTIRRMSLLSLLSLWSLLSLTACGDPTYSAQISNEPKGGPSAMATVTKYHDTVADAQTGRPIANAAVTITNYPAGTAATLYDAAGNVSSAPIVTDSTGYFSTYLSEGFYTITVTAGSLSRKYEAVMVGPTATYGSQTGNVSGFTQAVSATLKWGKIGRVVTVTLPQVSGLGNDNALQYQAKLPAGFRPPYSVWFPIYVMDAASNPTTDVIGTLWIDPTGLVAIYKGASGVAFTAGASIAARATSVSFLTD